jgi:hypothetical protein
MLLVGLALCAIDLGKSALRRSRRRARDRAPRRAQLEAIASCEVCKGSRRWWCREHGAPPERPIDLEARRIARDERRSGARFG